MSPHAQTAATAALTAPSSNYGHALLSKLENCTDLNLFLEKPFAT